MTREEKRISDAAYKKAHKAKILSKAKAYYKANQERILAYGLKYREANKEKVAQYMKKYGEDHRQEAHARKKKWEEANLEKVRARKTEWRKSNEEKMKACRNAYTKAHPEKVKANGSNQAARRRGAEGRHTAEEIRRLLARQKCLCAVCKKSIETGYHKDHIIPLSRGGPNYIRNIQLLCPTCNCKKGSKHPITFMQEMGYLL